MLRLIFACISFFMTGCFGWMLFGKFKQNALMWKLLHDPDRLARFIKALDPKQIAVIGERLVRKDNSYRNNLEDVVEINSYASTSSKFMYGLFTVLGLLSGLFIHRYAFWADLVILAVVANLRIPRLMAEWAFKDIRLMIAIIYRFRQEEPIQYLQLLVELPAYGLLEEAITRAENASAKTHAEFGNGAYTGSAVKEGHPAPAINIMPAE
jgi:hypothetical protein